MHRFIYRGKTPQGEWAKGAALVVNEEKNIIGILNMDGLDVEANRSGSGTLQIVDLKTVGQLIHRSIHLQGDIFEGDIVRYQDEEGMLEEDGVVAVIRWGGNEYPAFDLYTWDKQREKWETLDIGYNALSAGTIEVIGNIHDSPELIY